MEGDTVLVFDISIQSKLNIIKAGVHLKAVFPPLNLQNCVQKANISFAFQAIQKPSAHFTNLCFAVICKFLGEFLEEIVFSQRFSKIWRNIEDLIFKIRI